MPKDMRGIMHEFKHGELHSGSKSGPKVTNRKQAIAIGLSEQRRMGKSVPPKSSKSANGKKSAPKSRSMGRMGYEASHIDRNGPTPVGFGALSRKVKVLNNPKGLAARRQASRGQVYQNMPPFQGMPTDLGSEE